MCAVTRTPLGRSIFFKAVSILFSYCALAATVAAAQNYNPLVSFDGTNGANPKYMTLVQGPDGKLYGTTESGGTNNFGTVFQVTPNGTLTSLYSFAGGASNGMFPFAGLVLGSDGNFYGTTMMGGTSNMGTVFKITPTGTLTTLHSFNGNDGSSPQSALTLGSDGNFYGTTSSGGANTFGTVFKITPGGTLTTLHSFNGTEGIGPVAGVVQGSDGNFYGTTVSGGANSVGTVYKISPDGHTVSTLHSFIRAEGAQPYAALLQASDGNFYGTTSAFGENFAGAVFKISPDGSTFATLHHFCALANCTDGAGPKAQLIQGTDGNFYGPTTGFGGGNGQGNLFKITPAGVLTTLYTFTDLPSALGGLIQVNGVFYGATFEGGTSSQGDVYSLTTGQYLIPVTPCRLVDTRNPDGPFGGPAIQGMDSRSFPIPQNTNCNIPASAAAYSLNVTVVPHGPLNYLTIWPTGQDQPLVSTMNSYDGRTKANAAIVPAGGGGLVSVFVTDTSDVILDIDGYFAIAGAQTLQFYPLAPCRVVDTRTGSTQPQGLGPPFLGDMEIRDLPILTSPCLQGVSNPKAYSLNVTVVPNPAGQQLGYLTLWPSDQTQPLVSTLNNPTATVVANGAIVPAAANGNIKAFVYNRTDVVMDINGYFAAPSQSGFLFYRVVPCRAYDSRSSGDHEPFQGERTVNVMGSVCAPPSGAQAYVFNATVVPVDALGYLTLWPDGQDQPLVSTLNAYDGLITSNFAIVPNMNGSLDAYASQLTHLILDISGYFAP